MRVAIIQSNYVPWKGYFDIIGSVDLFVFYDDVQYTKRDWRNRNLIKTPRGVSWLTVPCGTGGRRLIHEVRLEDPSWQRRHWETLRQNYREAAHWDHLAPLLEEFYLKQEWTSLSELNQAFIRRIARGYLGIETRFGDSREHDLGHTKSRRLLGLLMKVGATDYLTGPTAKAYLDEAAFDEAGVRVEYVSYDGYPEYRQLHGPFVHGVSILDLLLNEGPRAAEFMKSRRFRSG